MAEQNDSHLSIPTKGNEKGPIPMHKRAALGEKVNGQSDPNGGRGSTEKKIGNAPVTY